MPIFSRKTSQLSPISQLTEDERKPIIDYLSAIQGLYAEPIDSAFLISGASPNFRSPLHADIADRNIVMSLNADHGTQYLAEGTAVMIDSESSIKSHISTYPQKHPN